MNGEPKGKLPMKAPGCALEFWHGTVGISETLVVFDGPLAAAGGSDLSVRSRRALAAHMIALWSRFGNGDGAA